MMIKFNYLINIVFILLFNTFSTNYFTPDLKAQNKYIFTIRIDDIQSRGTQTPRSILKFSEMVAKHNAKISWCVIPHRLIENQNKDGILAKEIKETITKYGFEVYQHGYNHICPKCGQTSHEMYCSQDKTPFSYELQRDTVLKGYKILQDSLKLNPIGFVSPGHAQDSTTFKVLSDLNFQYISFPDNIIGSRIFNLRNIPVNQEFTWSLTDAIYNQQMNGALDDIDANFQKMHYYAILLHDPFIREGYSNGIVIKYIDELLTALEKKYGDTLQYLTLTQAAQSNLVKIKDVIAISNIKIENLNINTYPNPFNNSVIISWSLPENENFKIGIYDSKGSRIYEKDFGYLGKGNYNFNWNADNNSSGIYFVKIDRGNAGISFKKLLLLK